MNQSDALDTYFKRISKRIRSPITVKTNEFLPLSDKVVQNREWFKEFQRAPVEPKTVSIEVDQRLETFNKVKKLQANLVAVRRILRFQYI